jgi:Tfp pilus assembly protein PilE
MGQQQLILLILVTIIIGIATVVALNVFGTSASNANFNAVRQDMLTIAASSQGWYIKPESMGGGGKSFAGMKFTDINFPFKKLSTDGLQAANMNGTYVLSNEGQTFILTAYPASITMAKGTKIVTTGKYMKCEVSLYNVKWLQSSP